MTGEGLFIVFEGIDGSGKTTQIEMLRDYFMEKGYKVNLTKEPTEDLIGSILWKYMKSKERSLAPETEALLFAADRIEHGKWISDIQKRGEIVISDRYLHSSLAYQGAAGVELDWIRLLNNQALKPDIVILLDIGPDSSLERVIDRARTVFEENNYLMKVRELYLNFADKGELVVVDATQNIEKVHSDIKKQIESLGLV
jgi:dTMP kinase